ncbi:hypothetical protein MKW92_003176 [Papaver armeniacum]|nr:hypothetical protein MKW92_003176 [Papaver armeniacum]
MGVFSLFGWFLFLQFAAVFTDSAYGDVKGFTGTYGINYGRIADNIPSPDKVVKLLKAAKIKNVRIYDADHSVLKAFKGSGLDLVIGLPNEYLKDMSFDPNNAMSWVRTNVQQFLPETRIRGIAVGNEVLGGNNHDNEQALVGAVKNIYNAINKLHLADIVQITTAHSQAVFSNSYPPSSCIFRADIVQYMKPLLQFFSQIGSPFCINVYPFLAYMSDPEHINLNYSLFLLNDGIDDNYTKLHYDNMFDAQVDASYAALNDAGFSKMEVIVTETGWASHGDDNEAVATHQNARTYNYNLRKRLAKRKGTPYRPKIPARAYIFALFNENLKPGPTSERNFGLYKPDGSISYNIGFPSLSSASSSMLSMKVGRVQTSLGLCSMVVTTCAAVLLVMMV